MPPPWKGMKNWVGVVCRHVERKLIMPTCWLQPLRNRGCAHLQSPWVKVAGSNVEDFRSVLNRSFGECGLNKEIQKVAEEPQSCLEIRGCVLFEAPSTRHCDLLQAAWGRKSRGRGLVMGPAKGSKGWNFRGGEVQVKKLHLFE